MDCKCRRRLIDRLALDCKYEILITTEASKNLCLIHTILLTISSPVKITNKISPRGCIFNFFNDKNFFRPIWRVAFSENDFIF